MAKKKTEISMEEFVKNNMDEILAILDAQGSETEEGSETEKKKTNKCNTCSKKKMEDQMDKVKEEKERFKEVVKGTVEAFTSREVQEHLMSAGIELMLAFGTMLKNIPVPSVFEPATEMVGEQMDAVGAVVRKRPAKPKKKEETIEKIELD
jgi:hypothetical protein